MLNSRPNDPGFYLCLLALAGGLLGCTPAREDTRTSTNASVLSYLQPGRVTPAGAPRVTYFNPDALKTAPAKGKALTILPPTVVPTNTNIHPAGNPKVIDISGPLPVFSPGKDGIPLPRTVEAKGRKAPALHPQSVPALTPDFKDNAIVNVQCLEVDQGMSSSSILSIMQDRRGHLWFGTVNGGISRYDGSSFIHLTPREGLSSDDVFSILEDSGGNLWFSYADGAGVSRYDGSNFTHFAGDEGLTTRVVYTIIQDSRGNLWFGTEEHGAVKYDGHNFTYFTTREGLSSNDVFSIIEDSRGNLWFGTESGGFCMYDGQSFTHFPEKEGLSNNTVLSMGKDSEGNLWIGTEGGGVCKYVQGSFRHYTDKEGLKSNPVRTILEDSRGNLWLGTHRGDISKYDGKSFTHYTLKEDRYSWIISSLEDSRGDLWFGTFGDGVYRFDSYSGPGPPRLTQFSEPEGLSRKNVELMLEDSQGNLWFGTFEGGVTKFDGKNFTYFTENEGLGNNSVISLLEDSRGNLWFGAYSGGVSRFDGKSFATFTVEQGLSHNIVRTIMEDSRGNLWFGTEGGGVDKYDGTNFTHYTLKEGLAENNIRSVKEDEKGNFWFATMNGLFYVLFGESIAPNSAGPAGDAPAGRIRVVEFGKPSGLKGVNFLNNSVCVDRNHQIWWGSEKGLTVLDLDDITLAAAPPHIQLNQISLNQNFVDFRNQEDVRGYDLQMNGVKPFYNYPLELELPYQTNSLTFYYSAIDWTAPQMIAYQYRLEGYDKTWSHLTKETKAEYRNLPHGTFTFEVKAIGEAGIWSQPLAYRFIIHPPLWQTKWAYAFYLLLISGCLYTLRRYELQRRRKKQMEEIERARIEEKSKQAEKIEAQALELEKSFQELQEKNEEIIQARDQLIVQEKLASLGHLTAGIAHEIKNPLNFINNFAEGSSELVDELLEAIEHHRDRLDPAAYQHMKEMLLEIRHNAIDIEKNGRKVDRIVRSMMDHARGTDFGWQAVDLNELLDENANLAYHSYRAIDPSFAVDIQKTYDDALPTIMTLPQHMGRVFLNILNNACYAVNQKQKELTNGYQPVIQLMTRALDDDIEIRIRDNGPGIPAEIRREIFTPFFTTKPTGVGNTGLGLSISYDIVVKEHHGKLEVESEPGEFTEFIISLPKDKVNEPN